MYLTQRAIGRRADDREPKLAVGRAGLRIMRANMCQGRECDREVQCWAWWLLSYKAFLRCSEAASIRWEDVKFRQDRDGGRSMWFRLTVSGREIFKNHSESVELGFRVIEDRSAWFRRWRRGAGDVAGLGRGGYLLWIRGSVGPYFRLGQHRLWAGCHDSTGYIL